MDLFTAIFGRMHHLTVGQECARAVLVLLYGLALVRLAGRRVFGKWSALDIIVSIMIGSALARAMTGNAPLFGTLAACAVLIALHWVLAQASARSTRLSYLLEGPPVDLGRDGEASRRLRTRHGVSDADLDEALRQSGFEKVEETRKITLEPSGKISVLK
ncbi:MAG TPA: YetF domain-containing protein [Sphingomonas sp.]|nr:YetF domain-containing protein [Sphingomonas sp.]